VLKPANCCALIGFFPLEGTVRAGDRLVNQLLRRAAVLVVLPFKSSREAADFFNRLHQFSLRLTLFLP